MILGNESKEVHPEQHTIVRRRSRSKKKSSERAGPLATYNSAPTNLVNQPLDSQQGCGISGNPRVHLLRHIYSISFLAT
jgi:hypothetical protein